jgi:hypothetical protein
MSQSKQCPKCAGTTTDGYIADQGYGTYAVPK